MNDDTSKKSVFIMRGGDSVLTDVELIEWIDHFGRSHVQEFVAKRQDMRDVIAYLRAERNLELAKVTTFVTSEPIHFERDGAPYLSLRGLGYVQKMD